MAGIPKIFELLRIFLSEDECIAFLMRKGILPSRRTCHGCSAEMKFYSEKKQFQCPRKGCRKSISVRDGTFFSKQKLSFSEIMFLGYLWLCQASIKTISILTGHSSTTICSFQKYFRQLVADSLDLEDVIVGGPGVVVELDESKLGKRKYNRGHRVDGVWVLGGVERTDERKLFLAKVPDRSRETLFAVIQRHVSPGSIIHTDMWRGYVGLGEVNGYEHLTVNHSVEFVVPGTSIHTNTIEGTWNGLKMQIKPRNRTQDIDDHLCEFEWRRRHADGLWEAFSDAFKDVQYVG